jgi:LysR family transcriptional regulator, transcriptional activator of nhaA
MAVNQINFNHLYYFVMIAREKSVSAACKKLFVTQPTLSGQLHQLEESLGKKLFDRKKKRLFLNRYGELTLQYASQIFRLRDEMMSALTQERRVKITRVNVGVLPSLDKAHIHKFATSLWDSGCSEVSIREADTRGLLSSLKAGSVDVILIDTKAFLRGTSLSNTELYRQNFVAVASPEWKSLKEGFPGSLHKKPFLNFTRHSGVHEEIAMFFKERGVQPDLAGEIDDLTLLCLAAQEGKFFSVVPRQAVAHLLDEGKLIELGELETVASQVWAVTRGAGTCPEVVQRAIGQFKDVENGNATDRPSCAAV